MIEMLTILSWYWRSVGHCTTTKSGYRCFHMTLGYRNAIMLISTWRRGRGFCSVTSLLIWPVCCDDQLEVNVSIGKNSLDRHEQFWLTNNEAFSGCLCQSCNLEIMPWWDETELLPFTAPMLPQWFLLDRIGSSALRKRPVCATIWEALPVYIWMTSHNDKRNCFLLHDERSSKNLHLIRWSYLSSILSVWQANLFALSVFGSCHVDFPCYNVLTLKKRQKLGPLRLRPSHSYWALKCSKESSSNINGNPVSVSRKHRSGRRLNPCTTMSLIPPPPL